MVKFSISPKAVFSLLFLLFSLPSFSQSSGVQLPTTTEGLDGAFWSLSIQDAESGEELVGVRSHHLFTPASTLKLLSTGTVHSVRYPSERIPTYVCAVGKVSEGTLQGDLYIIGHGDPSLGSRYLYGKDRDVFFKEAFAALHRLGIRRVSGGIKALSPPSDAQGWNPRWLHYDMGNHYAAGVYQINLFDNSYEVLFSEYGRKFRLSPDIPGLKLEPAYETSRRRYSDSLYISIVPNNRGEREITGVYPATRPTLSIRGDIPDPPLFMAQYFDSFLKKKGVSITSLPSTVSSLPSAPLDTLYTYLSPTIDHLVSITNTYSHNLFAEGLLRLLAEGHTPLEGQNTTQTALLQARKYWVGRGLDFTETDLFDGSGLSPQNKVSAHFLTSLLGKIYRGDPQHLFMRTLPQAGREGTLVHFLKETPLEGKARLKSGTIRNVVCYAGYVTLQGKVYTVALMVNNFTGKTSQMRKEMERVLLSSFRLSRK